MSSSPFDITDAEAEDEPGPSTSGIALDAEAEQLAARVRALSQRADRHYRSTQASADELVLEASSVAQALRALEDADRRAGSRSGSVRSALSRIHGILNGNGPGGDLHVLQAPLTNGIFVRSLLGTIDLRRGRPEERLKIKDEYNKARDSATQIYIIAPLVLLALRHWPLLAPAAAPFLPILLAVYKCWLLSMYAGLAFRENVLRLNGSNIRNWWIYHHYFAIAMVLTMLTMPDHDPTCQAFTALFLAWAVLQGAVMLLQNRYQRLRQYTLICTGGASTMDVVSGESGAVGGQLQVLYPALFALQGLEFYCGAIILADASKDWRADALAAVLAGGGIEAFRAAGLKLLDAWQPHLCAALFLTMAIGNAVTTVATIIAKRRIGRMRATKIGGGKNS